MQSPGGFEIHGKSSEDPGSLRILLYAVGGCRYVS